MRRKHFALTGIIISATLLLVATNYYPGGSQYSKKPILYDWKNNYPDNLSGDKSGNESGSITGFGVIDGRATNFKLPVIFTGPHISFSCAPVKNTH